MNPHLIDKASSQKAEVELVLKSHTSHTFPIAHMQQTHTHTHRAARHVGGIPIAMKHLASHMLI